MPKTKDGYVARKQPNRKGWARGRTILTCPKCSSHKIGTLHFELKYCLDCGNEFVITSTEGLDDGTTENGSEDVAVDTGKRV